MKYVQLVTPEEFGCRHDEEREKARIKFEEGYAKLAEKCNDTLERGFTVVHLTGHSVDVATKLADDFRSVGFGVRVEKVPAGLCSYYQMVFQPLGTESPKRRWWSLFIWR